MPKKKTEEIEEIVSEPTEAAVEEPAVETASEEVAAADAAAAEKPEIEAAPAAEEKPKAAKKAAPKKEKTAKKEGTAPASTEVKKTSKRAEKIGIVSSDKMMKTVTVRVDRLVKHPIYRKYVKKRKKFMAHDEMGAKIGDKVKIVETRPLSARKRWRVVEIIHKAEL